MFAIIGSVCHRRRGARRRQSSWRGGSVSACIARLSIGCIISGGWRSAQHIAGEINIIAWRSAAAAAAACHRVSASAMASASRRGIIGIARRILGIGVSALWRGGFLSRHRPLQRQRRNKARSRLIISCAARNKCHRLLIARVSVGVISIISGGGGGARSRRGWRPRRHRGARNGGSASSRRRRRRMASASARRIGIGLA